MRQLEFVLPAAIEINRRFLTDHNRSELSIQNDRLANDVRTQFGELRRYFKADKKTFSVSWDMLTQDAESTVDGNLGAEDMIEFFESITGVADLTIYYDFGDEKEYKVVITSFSATLKKRWNPYRFYDVSLTMEEV
jgi:hypothetical protein